MRKVWILLLCALLLSACGDLDDYIPEPEPDDGGLAEFEEQEINWATCDVNVFTEEDLERLAPLGDRLECATLKTPLDWEDPARDAINLGVLRVRAADETQRKGAIFLNPGGPGGDGLFIGAIVGLIFATAGDENSPRPVAAPELLSQVSEQYDIVGFSPRGVGGSFQLFCGNNQNPPPANFFTDRSEENVQALLTEASVIADACKNNPLTDFVTTEQTVQDMDLIRRLLGDEKLNYLGYSYGSWLGAWYAKRFPENAGNMVLDANTEFSADFQDVFTLQGLGFQRGFEDVAAAYIARNNALFELGDTQDAVYNVYEGFREDIKAALLFGEASFLRLLYSSDSVPVVGLNLMAAKGVSTVLNGLASPPVPETYGAFLEAVATFEYSGNADLNTELVNLATVIATDYLGYREFTGATDPNPEEPADPEPEDPADPADPTDPDPEDPTPDPEDPDPADPTDPGITLDTAAILNPGDAVFTAITCNDSPWNQDPSFFTELGNEQDEQYPFIGGLLTSQPCAYWGEPVASMPDIPEDFPELLLVQSGYDGATPAEGAIRAFESLPNASFLYVENELSHTVFPYNTECVDVKVAQYLLDGSLPDASVSNCDALPLPGETEVFAPGTAPSIDGAATTQALSVQAAQSAGENELYDLVHKMLREDAANFFGQ